MFKKTIQFEDLDGNTVRDVFYFNFSKLEVIEMLELDDLENKMERLTEGADEKGLTNLENTREAYEIFKDLILKAHGKKSADNRRFEKVAPDGHRYRDDFQASAAFDEMILEFLSNPALAAEFVENCLPPKMVAEAKASGKLDDTEVKNLVQEAARRQENPETAVKPGVPPIGEEATYEEVRKSGLAVAPEPEPEKTFTDYTEKELLEMSQDEFVKLLPSHVKEYSRDQLMIAMQRKNKQQ